MLSSLPRRAYIYLMFLGVSILYIVASLLAPLGPNRFNLSNTNTRLVQLAILLPIVLIWTAAVFGAERFHNYSNTIRSYKDGRAMNSISVGLLILVVSIITNGLIGVVRPWALKDGWLSAYTIFTNYISVSLPLIAYIFMYLGSVGLVRITKKPAAKQRRDWLFIGLLLAILAALYIIALLNFDYRTSTPDPNKYSSFYMSDPLILLTLALPYLIGWGLGIKAAFNLNHYHQHVKGVIYKKSLLSLEIGILIVIFFYIIVQLLIAFSTYFAKAGLGSILIVVYLLIMLYAAGFLIIASGARKLAAIEKVK